MPDNTYMEVQKNKLLESLAKIEEELDFIGERTHDGRWRPKFVDLSDGAQREVADEQAFFEANLGMIMEFLSSREKIVKALQKINDRNYGKCEICMAEISKERLDVLPEADHCIKCEINEEN